MHILIYNSECIHRYTRTGLGLAWLWFSAILELEARASCIPSLYSTIPALVNYAVQILSFYNAAVRYMRRSSRSQKWKGVHKGPIPHTSSRRSWSRREGLKGHSRHRCTGFFSLSHIHPTAPEHCTRAHISSTSLRLRDHYGSSTLFPWVHTLCVVAAYSR